ncbi:hypothetical protein [Paracoccus indicus]|uniref:hypothetical protein n=1 Tax=Paracoccus indicus TaxID=2079229 RepID=UPI000D39F405|nr:hypothetical protein [Paracoccus indicus]
MKPTTTMIAALSTITMIATTPALADKPHDDQARKRPAHMQSHKMHQDNDRHRASGHDKSGHRAADHDRKDSRRPRIGDHFSRSGFEHVRDPGSLGLERSRRWEYYRKGSDVYRVDSDTQKVLAIIDMLKIFGG